MKKLLAILLLLSNLTPVLAQTNISQGGTGWATSTFGDLLVGTTSKIRYTRLPVGSTGQVLWVLGGQPAWVSTSSLGITGTGGSGNSAWTIGTNVIYNATATDFVAIGTTTARAKLDVTRGTANIDGNASNVANFTGANQVLTTSNANISINTNDSFAADLGGGITFGGLYATGNTANVNWATVKSGKTNGVSGDYSGYLSFATRNNGFNMAEAMRINNLGNVGIASTSPIGNLSIVGNASTSYLLAMASSTGSLLFTFGSNGRVGVGTSTPGTNVDIWGSFRVATSSTPTLYASTIDRLVSINALPSPNAALTVAATTTGSTGITITTVTTGTAINANTITSGSVLTSTGLTTGIGIDLSATGLTSGIGVSCPTTAAGLTSGACLRATGSRTLTADQTSSFVDLAPIALNTASSTRVLSGGAINVAYSVGNSGGNASVISVTGTTTNFTRYISASSTGATSSIAVTGPLMAVFNIKTPGTSTSTDSSNVVSIGQLNASSTGTVLSLFNAGTGDYMNLSSTTGGIVFDVDRSGSVGIGTSTFNSLFSGRFTVDSSKASTTGGMIAIGNINNFFESNVINTSNGAGAQACQTATNNLGSLTTGFVAICANSSGFNNPQTYNTGGAGDTSIMGYSTGDFIIANATSTRNMYFLTGGSATSTNTRMTITGAGNIGIGTSTPISTLSVVGSMYLSGAFNDATYASGTIGQVLQTTGTSTRWVSTSTLGFPTPTTYTGTYPIIVSGSVISTGFSTSTANVFSSAQTINNNLTVTGTTALTNTTISNATSSAHVFNTSASLKGLLYDSINATGTSGQVLQSTGTSTIWATISGALSGGVNGRNAFWTSASTLGNGSLYDNGTVSGANATSSTVAFNVQGLSSLATIFNVASSTGSAIFSIFSNGQLLYGTTTQATCGGSNCGMTVGTTTQFTAGVVSRVVGYSSAASTTINLNTTDVATTTINQPTTFVNPVGTAYDGSMFEIRAKATTTQTIYWGTSFASSTDLTNVSSVASGTTRFLFEYRQDVQKWELVGKLGGYIN